MAFRVEGMALQKLFSLLFTVWYAVVLWQIFGGWLNK